MNKINSLIIIVVILLMFLFISCSKQVKVPLGDIIWKSSIVKVSVSISSKYAFRAVGTKTINGPYGNYQYFVYKNDEGRIIYIIDYKAIKKFDEDYDLVEPETGQEGLIGYQPYEYSIWTGISKFSENVLEEMGINVPRCKLSLITARLNEKDTHNVMFLVLVEPWNCERDNYDKIIDHYNDIIFIW